MGQWGGTPPPEELVDSCDRPRTLRPPNCCPASSCATRTRLHRSDRANMHRAAALHQRGWSVVLLCNGFWLAPGPLCSAWPLHLTSPTNAPASVTRTHLHLSDRTNVHRAAAPIGGAARCRPTFVTAVASDSPYSQSGLCVSRAPPAHPRRCCACTCAPGHAPICRRCLIPLRRPDRSRTAIFCPHIAVPQAPAAERVNLNPWRLTRSCTASGHAPAAQNCPRSRTRLTTWLRRFSGAANAAVGGVGSGGGGWKRDLENASLSRNLRATVRCF